MSKLREIPQIGIIAKPVKHQVAATGALERCLRNAGYRVRATYDATASESIVICWGWGKAKEVRMVNPSAVILCLDHGFTWKRKQYVNTGWSTPDDWFGLNGFAEHPVVFDGGERSRAKGWWDELRPIQNKENRVMLLLGQVYGDAMIVDHVEDYGAWLRKVSDQYVQDGWTIYFRPHPIMVMRGTVSQYGNVGRMSATKELTDDLLRVRRAVAMNSNALIQAYTSGVETVAYNKGSMLAPLMPGPGEVIPWRQREEWWARMAYCQWDYDELENGHWLAYHQPILERLARGGASRPWNRVLF